MELVIYRHAEPIVSSNETISGCNFSRWVQKYNASGIRTTYFLHDREEVVHTSNLLRSIETGRIIGKKIIESPLLREAETPLLRFPAIHLKAKAWLFISRSLWLLGAKTRCESFLETKLRVKRTVDMFESLLPEERRIVVIGHGFINRMIKKELLHRGWRLQLPHAGHGYLSKMILEAG